MSKEKDITFIRVAWSLLLIIGFVATIFGLHNDPVFVIKLLLTIGLIATLVFMLDHLWSDK